MITWSNSHRSSVPPPSVSNDSRSRFAPSPSLGTPSVFSATLSSRAEISPERSYKKKKKRQLETGVCICVCMQRDDSGGFGITPSVLSPTLSSRAEMSPETSCAKQNKKRGRPIMVFLSLFCVRQRRACLR